MGSHSWQISSESGSRSSSAAFVTTYGQSYNVVLVHARRSRTVRSACSRADDWLPVIAARARTFESERTHAAGRRHRPRGRDAIAGRRPSPSEFWDGPPEPTAGISPPRSSRFGFRRSTKSCCPAMHEPKTEASLSAPGAPRGSRSQRRETSRSARRFAAAGARTASGRPASVRSGRTRLSPTHVAL